MIYTNNRISKLGLDSKVLNTYCRRKRSKISRNAAKVMENGGGEKLIEVKVELWDKYCECCMTRSTPMWRRGPTGPLSLCNACGILYRKTETELLFSCSSLSEEVSYEELKQQQKEMQMKMLVLLTSMKKSRMLKKNNVINNCTKAKEDEVGYSCMEKNEVEEAALLLLSLSSQI